MFTDPTFICALLVFKEHNSFTNVYNIILNWQISQIKKQFQSLPYVLRRDMRVDANSIMLRQFSLSGRHAWPSLVLVSSMLRYRFTTLSLVLQRCYHPSTLPIDVLPLMFLSHVPI